MRFRLCEVAGKPILIVWTIERFSAFRAFDSIHDETKQQAGTKGRPSSRKEDQEQRLRLARDGDGKASKHSEQPRHEECDCENIDLADSS